MSWQPMSDVTAVARKDHVCIWCGDWIREGMAYHRNTGKMDGDFQCNRYHPECWKAASDYFRSGEDMFEPQSFKRGSTVER